MASELTPRHGTTFAWRAVPGGVDLLPLLLRDAKTARGKVTGVGAHAGGRRKRPSRWVAALKN